MDPCMVKVSQEVLLYEINTAFLVSHLSKVGLCSFLCFMLLAAICGTFFLSYPDKLYDFLTVNFVWAKVPSLNEIYFEYQYSLIC